MGCPYTSDEENYFKNLAARLKAGEVIDASDGLKYALELGWLVQDASRSAWQITSIGAQHLAPEDDGSAERRAFVDESERQQDA